MTALRYDINLSIRFTELPLLQRPAAAAAAGFTAVEFWWPFDRAVPDGSDVDRFCRGGRGRGCAAGRVELLRR